jgi:hypothetical protein
MKKEVTDIQALHVELDSEDQELMQMFPRSRMSSLQDMLLIQKGEEIFLIRKEYVARKRKLVHAIIWTALGAFCFLFLAASILSAITGNGDPGLYALLFELCLLPYLLKVPREVVRT